MTIFDHTLISFQLSKLKLERYCSVIQMVTQHLWIILLAHYVYVQCIRSLCYGLCTNNHGTFWFKKMQIILAKTLFGSIALLSHNTLKWSAILGLSFFAQCWLKYLLLCRWHNSIWHDTTNISCLVNDTTAYDNRFG